MDPSANTLEPAPAVLAVTMVHGTFPRGLWLQLRRNLRALWSRLCGRQVEEATLWPEPASKPDQRCWFEEGSEFERDLVRRTGLPPGSVVFDRFLWSGRNTFADRTKAARSLRTALRESTRKHPGVSRVVLAHSHGGTVAVKALDRSDESRGGGETPGVRALLTLATPFVRLVWRWPVSERDEHRVPLVALVLPMMLLPLAPFMALDLGLRSDGVAQVVAAAVLGITALLAAWRASLIVATTIIAIVLSLGSVALCWDLLMAAAFFAMAGVGLAPAAWALRLFEVGLPCPLLALRAPRDEASLIIGLGQVAQGLWHATARFLVLAARPLGRRLVRDGTDQLYLVLVAAMCLLVLVSGWFNVWTPPSLKEVGWYEWGTANLKVPSRVVLEFGDAISGISRVSGQAARSIG